MLAAKLTEYSGRRDVIVLALPRGGVPVGFEIAAALGAWLDPFLIRKLPVPENEELEMGAISTGGATVLDAEVISYLQISASAVDSIVGRERVELDRRWTDYCGQRRAHGLREKTVILSDDGFASVWFLGAAVKALQQLEAKHIIIVAPIMSRWVVDAICPLVGCLHVDAVPIEIETSGDSARLPQQLLG